MYETKRMENYPSTITITGPDKAAVGSAPLSLNQRADYVLEEAAKLRAFAATFAMIFIKHSIQHRTKFSRAVRVSMES